MKPPFPPGLWRYVASFEPGGKAQIRDENGDLSVYEVVLKCWDAKGYIAAVGLRKCPKEGDEWWTLTERGWERKRR